MKLRRVFLIHGMGRTPASMWALDRRLRREGYRPSLFGYFVTATDLDEIAERFARHIERVLAADAASRATTDEEASYAIVSHSLGGIVTRMISSKLPPGLACCVMLAPPNQPPVMVQTLADKALFRFLTRDAGRKLGDPKFYESLPVPDVPILVVAGTRGPLAEWLPFRGEANDAVLRVDETHLEGAATLEVEGVHTFLMNRTDVFAAIREFFSTRGFPAP